ncbi:ISL3 family transposase [Candidatus Stoquefichus sp. SB1]|uniref:ISL3 family transposase n=1 Tax=Candidatus Stoquefichus sp. SB1 TaxID=1658109 RepID=UPI001E43A5BD|nr:ISL3 family transposase [Candidatus Stoquefichus sp. SB1]
MKAIDAPPLLEDGELLNTTIMPIISENDILKFFNLEKDDIQEFRITHQSDGIYICIRLNVKYHQCPVCGQMTDKIKDYSQKKIIHSVLNYSQCFIIYEARRYRCPHCHKTFFEHNPFVFGSSRISVATVSNILRDLKLPNETFTSVARRYHVSVTSVINIFDDHVRISRRPLPACLGIDEVYAFKTYKSKFVCVLVDCTDQKIVDVLPTRKKDDLISYFMLIPREEREKVLYCSFDMWETYRIVARHVFPNASCCIDKFHVVQELGRRMDKVRISAQKKYMTQIRELQQKKKNIGLTKEEEYIYEEASRHYYVLKKFNWMFISTDNRIFDPNEEKRYNRRLEGYYNYYDLFDYMVKYDRELDIAYDLKDSVTRFYRQCHYEDAKKKLEEIIIDFRCCPIEEMSQFANTLTRWKQEIINSFMIVDREKNRKMNTAIVENRNKSIKLIKHASNGYLNWERFRNKILFSLNSDTTYYLNIIKKEDK